MFVLGLQGSPRKKGNSHHLLTTFMSEAEKSGARCRIIDVPRQAIRPCLELIVCEKKGFCPIEDDMQREIYALIRKADVIVMASPVFFYAVPAQLKGLIDRCQIFWARKYKFHLSDPNKPWRRGLLLAVGATQGKELFYGLDLTAKYFFDAVDAAYQGSLTYPNMEGPNDLKGHPDMKRQVAEMARNVLKPFKNRLKILFTCRKNDSLSQMAAAMAQYQAGDILEAMSAGSTPAAEIHPNVIKVMADRGIDLAYRRPQSLDSVLEEWQPDVLVGMDCWEACPFAAGIRRIKWENLNPRDDSIDSFRLLRDEIEGNVVRLIDEFRRSNSAPR